MLSSDSLGIGVEGAMSWSTMLSEAIKDGSSWSLLVLGALKRVFLNRPDFLMFCCLNLLMALAVLLVLTAVVADTGGVTTALPPAASPVFLSL
jgi:hypothetical protein